VSFDQKSLLFKRFHTGIKAFLPSVWLVVVADVLLIPVRVSTENRSKIASEIKHPRIVTTAQ